MRGDGWGMMRSCSSPLLGYLTAIAAGIVALAAPDVDAAPAQPAAVGSEPSMLPPIVLEAHVGQRSQEAVKALGVVLDELERHGYAALPETVARTLGGQAPRPGVLDGGKTAKDIAQEIETGLEFYNQGKFRDAEVALMLARQDMKRNPSLIVLDTTNEKSIFNAFVALALCQVKLNKTADAVETMTELQRISSTPIERAEYGPQAEQLWRSTQKRTRAMGIGALKITVNEARAMIFLDTRYRGLGKVSLGDVVPGSHSVLIQVPGTEGRQYEIGVRENETAALDVNWQVDSTLHISTPWAGLAFATELEREQEATYAKGLAHRWGRQSVIVVEPTRLGGTPVILGVVYPAAGDPSGAWVPINSGEQRLRDLARFLFDGTLAEGVSVLPRSAGAASITSRAATSDRGSTIPAMIVGGAGLLATTAGGIAYVASKGYDFRNPSAYVDRKTPALDVMLGGSLALGGGTYLWLRESRSAGVLPAVLLAAGATSIASGLELYLTDEDPGPTGPRYIRDTAAQGLVIGASGLALTGAGLWLLHRDSSARNSGSLARRGGSTGRYWVPAVVADSSHAMAVCVGSF